MKTILFIFAIAGLCCAAMGAGLTVSTTNGLSYSQTLVSPTNINKLTLSNGAALYLGSSTPVVLTNSNGAGTALKVVDGTGAYVDLFANSIASAALLTGLALTTPSGEARMTTTGFHLNSGGGFDFSSDPTDANSGNRDTKFARMAAGFGGVTNPAAGTVGSFLALSLTLTGTTNFLVFGATNAAPVTNNVVQRWVSVQVTGDTNIYRIPLYR